MHHLSHLHQEEESLRAQAYVKRKSMPWLPAWIERHTEAKVEEDHVEEEEQLHVFKGLLVLEVDDLANGLSFVVVEVIQRGDEGRNEEIVQDERLSFLILEVSDLLAQYEGLEVDIEVLDFMVLV